MANLETDVFDFDPKTNEPTGEVFNFDPTEVETFTIPAFLPSLNPEYEHLVRNLNAFLGTKPDGAKIK